MQRAAVALTLTLAALLAPAAGAQAGSQQRQVPFGFFGVPMDLELFKPEMPLESETRLMARSGVESLRFAAYWRVAQPYRSFADVPPAERARFRDVGGVPTDWSMFDAIVEVGARRGFRLLPALLLAPDWAARHPGAGNSPPSDFPAYGRFAAAMVRRYGPRGEFWRERPDLPRNPITDWQIWNEPNQGRFFWSDQPYVRDYVSLLRTARKAIRAEDPRARIVLAGLVGPSWTELERIYRAGGRKLFDIAAVHPFTFRVRNVLTIVEKFRRVMDRHGDRHKLLRVTELSWPTAKGKVPEPYGYEATEREQAVRIEQAFTEFATRRRALRLDAVIYYTWVSPDRGENSFDYAGIRRFDGTRVVPKQGYRTFTRTALRFAGCRKSDVATRCR